MLFNRYQSKCGGVGGVLLHLHQGTEIMPKNRAGKGFNLVNRKRQVFDFN